jgi:hypothetical protein
MQKHLQMIQFLQNVIGTIESDLKRAKLVLAQLTKFDPENAEAMNTMQQETQSIMGTSDLKSYSEENMEVVE